MNFSLLSLALCAFFGASLADQSSECPKFVERNDWFGQPPARPLTDLSLPVDHAIISHTVSGPCKTLSECVLRVRLIQSLHMESYGWDDIGYSFLIGGSGDVFVGRGWDKVGAHSYGWNNKSIGISFIGTFTDVTPTEKALEAARKLLNCGKAKGFLKENFKVLGHRQVAQTLSPGDKLYKLIQQWPEWQRKV